MKSVLKRLERKWGFLRTQDGLRKAPIFAAIRLISWWVLCSLGKATVVKLPRWDLQMFLPPVWRGFTKRAFAFRENYEPELIYMEKLISPGSVFLDIGANMGIYTLVASRLVGEGGQVFSFEPSTQSFPLLHQNISLNGLKNVRVFKVALSNNAGNAWLYHPGIPDGNSLGRDPSWGNEAEEVATETLDHMVEEGFLKWIDVMKIDVEGAEELVLRGATKVLDSMHPTVIFEVNAGFSALLGLSAQGASELLESYGYEVFVPHPSRMKSKARYYYNCVAVHKQRNRNRAGEGHVKLNSVRSVDSSLAGL